MYKCDNCGKSSNANEKMIRNVVQTRPVEYTDDNGRVIGRGHETVAEDWLCYDCAGEEKPTPKVKPTISLKKHPLFDFEIRLPGGKVHRTNSAASLAMFWKTNTPKNKRAVQGQ